jgi:hypothetical protein
VNQGVEENGPSTPSTGSGAEGTFVVYPNPAQGNVTIEGKGLLTVSNLLGQTILSREIDGRTTMALPRGFWLVRLNNTVKKVIVG